MNRRDYLEGCLVAMLIGFMIGFAFCSRPVDPPIVQPVTAVEVVVTEPTLLPTLTEAPRIYAEPVTTPVPTVQPELTLDIPTVTATPYSLSVDIQESVNNEPAPTSVFEETAPKSNNPTPAVLPTAGHALLPDEVAMAIGVASLLIGAGLLKYGRR